LHILTYQFFLYSFVRHRPLHSFPTRRSSDLLGKRTVLLDERGARPPRGRPCALPRWVVLGSGQTHDVHVWRHEESRPPGLRLQRDRKSTRLNSSHVAISYAVFCLKKKIYEST